MTTTITQPLLMAIETLEMSKAHINEAMLTRLKALLPDNGDVIESDIELFEIDDLTEMKALVKSIQKQVVNDRGEILSTATIRDLSSLTGCITSLVRLFKVEQSSIDNAKEIDEIFNACLASIGTLTPEQQKPFFDELSDTKWGMVRDIPK